MSSVITDGKPSRLRRLAAAVALASLVAALLCLAISAIQLLLVSNNPYQLARLRGGGTRERLDTGALGVAYVRVETAPTPKGSPRWRSRASTASRRSPAARAVRVIAKPTIVALWRTFPGRPLGTIR